MDRLLLLFLIASFWACDQGQPVTEPAPDASERQPVETVDSIWRSHERVIEAAISGGAIYEDRYMEACSFFESLTGIEIRGEGTYIGWLPNEHTAADLEAIREWYALNRHRLYLDAESHSVRLQPAREKAGEGAKLQPASP